MDPGERKGAKSGSGREKRRSSTLARNPLMEIAPPGGAKPDALDEPALGSNPFDDLPAPDAFLMGLSALRSARPAVDGNHRGELPPEIAATGFGELLDELGRPEHLEPVRARASTTAPAPTETEASGEDHAPATPLKARRWVNTPALADVDLPEVGEWVDRLLSPEDRRRLAAVAHLVEGEGPYDRFGLSAPVVKRAFPFFYALYRYYFRVQSQGSEHVPARGPVVVASNHAGLLPFDATMLVIDLLLKTDPPRLARTIVDRWAGSLPFVSVFYARVGQIVGTRENFADLLANGQLLLVFPEGMQGATKRVTQRYRLQKFHVGFVEQALRAQAPVVPVAVIGSDDQTPVLFDLAPIARPLGLPMLPITPTFPWLGPLGLLPYPVRYRIVYGEPLNFHERFGPEDAADARLVRYLSRQVRGAVQSLIDRHR